MAYLAETTISTGTISQQSSLGDKDKKKNNKHTHIVYVSDKIENVDDSGNGVIGYTSTDNGHAHEIMYIAPQPPQIDQMTGQVVQEATPEKYIVMPNKDGHMHEIGDFLSIPDDKLEKKTNKDEQKKRLEEYKELFVAASKDDESFIEHAREDEKMYFGDQWDPAIKRQMAEDNRPAHVFNKIEPYINTLIGIEIQNGTMPKVMPNEKGDGIIADILNGLNHYFFEKNDYSDVRNEVFEDLCVVGRGNYSIKIDYTSDIEGDIKISHAPWDSVSYTQHIKKDASDAEAVCSSEWVSTNQIKLFAPETKIEEIEKNAQNHSEFSSNHPIHPNQHMIEKHSKRVKLCSVQKRESDVISVIANIEDNYFLDGMDGRIPGWLVDAKTQKRILTIPGFIKFKKPVEEIWHGLYAGDVLLFDRRSIFSDFSYIPAYAKKRKYDVKGKVRDLIDPQQELNKSRSVISELSTKLSASGYIYDDSTFEDEGQEAEFIEQRSRPGYAVKCADARQNPPLVQSPVPLPTDLMALSEQSKRDIEDISGINPELLGIGNSSSAVLYQERRNSALVGNEYLFQGLSRADKALTKRLMEAYAYILTPNKVYKILESSDKKMRASGESLKLGGITFDKYSENEICKLWQSADVQQYDVAIGFGDNSPTKKAADLTMWLDLAKQGVQGINGEFLLSMSDVPPDQKAALQELTQQQANREFEIEKKRLSIEENKTAIAANSKEKIEREKIAADLEIARAQIASNERIALAKITHEENKLESSNNEKK